jgi:cation diffusion facilitator CzcD-associated flavoprotein CzcO
VTPDRPAGPDVIIMGAGVSGIAMAAALRRAGFDSILVLEQSQGVGGTWWDNRYPGAQCDVPSHLYSFSFAPNPDWSRVFAPAGEIQSYVERCVNQRDLARHMRLGVRVTDARWNEADGRWTVTTDRGDSYRPRIFVVSLGPLSHPRYPPGIEAFGGVVMHTSRWNPDYDFAGRSVAVIGSAASAIQVIPKLAEVAARLTVYQRTPSWIVARPDRPYRRIERGLFRMRAWARLYRWWLYWQFEARIVGFRGRGFVHATMKRMALRHLEEQVSSPALRERLRPSYPIGCKRILLSNEYYPALSRANVELVPSSASAFTATGIVAADGVSTQVDAIVCATGFDTMDPLAAVRIEGRDGKTLASAWSDGPEAYRGVAVPGFPNLFLMVGPNTGTGHTSLLIPIEAQARYVVDCVRELDRRGAGSLEVRADATRAYNETIQARLRDTVWASPACRSWYKTSSGRVVAIYPGAITRYALGLRRPRFDDYDFTPIS